MAHLDMQLKIGLLEELKSLQQRLNLTTVYIAHDCAEAEALTPRVVMMGADRIITLGGKSMETVHMTNIRKILTRFCFWLLALPSVAVAQGATAPLTICAGSILP
jgi:ABC-type sulfate/molybdate transport systems ATPase subunit